MTSAAPILKCADLVPSQRFYTQLLGFEEQWRWNGSDSQTNPAYVSVSLDGAELHLSSFDGDGTAGTAVYLRVDEVDGLAERLRARAPGHIEFGPANRPWGTRELYVRDLDHNQLRFSAAAGGSPAE